MSKGPGRARDYSLALPQIRTCAINAYGSSSHGLACPTGHPGDHEGRGEPVTLQQPAKRSPGEVAPTAAAGQPLPPDTHHPLTEPLDGHAIPRDPVVSEVAA